MHSSYIRQLDGLRFIAVLMVVLAHWVQPIMDSTALKQVPLAFGVKLFFVLSGYLITDILLKQRERLAMGNISIKQVLARFYARRSLRIFPLYYAAVAVAVISGLQYSEELLPWLLTYSTNIYMGIHETYLGEYTHFWSLAVEEQFYLVWPWFILLLPSAWLKYFIPASIVLSLGFRTYALYEINYFTMAYSTPAALSMLAIGGYLAWLRLNAPKVFGWLGKGVKWIVLLSVFIVLHYISYYAGWYWYFNIGSGTLFSFGCAMLIAACSGDKLGGQAGRLLKSDLAVHLGKLSYGIYVLHLFIPVLWLWICDTLGFDRPGSWINIPVNFILTY
ncbi:MAG: hypothetical protein RL220_1267, partial [Bacteroidota bacterium]